MNIDTETLAELLNNYEGAFNALNKSLDENSSSSNYILCGHYTQNFLNTINKLDIDESNKSMARIIRMMKYLNNTCNVLSK